MTLTDLIRSDWNNLVANVDELAETVRFQPEGGGAVRELVVAITEEAMVRSGPHLQERDEVILVSVGRDETADCGGIERPLLGDKLWRTNVHTPDLPYNWVGETPDANPANWTLRYRRTLPYRATAAR